MKIQFKDSSYIDCKQEDDKIIFIISSKDGNNPLKKVTNMVELTIDQYKQLIDNIKILNKTILEPKDISINVEFKDYEK